MRCKTDEGMQRMRILWPLPNVMQGMNSSITMRRMAATDKDAPAPGDLPQLLARLRLAHARNAQGQHALLEAGADFASVELLAQPE